MPITIHVSIPSTRTVRRQPVGNPRPTAAYTITKNGGGVGSAGNPLIIVRGSPNLALVADVAGQQRQIWWSLTPGSGSAHGASAPRLWHAQGRMNLLTTDAIGIYIVSAGYVSPRPPLGEAGLERTTLHVHFVAASVVFDSYRDDHTTDVSMPWASRLSITSLFEFKASACLNGGGPGGAGGASRVQLGVVQNVTMGLASGHELCAQYRRSKKSATTSSQSNAPKFGTSRTRTTTVKSSSEKSMLPEVPQFEEGWLFESCPTPLSPFVDCGDDESVPFYDIKLKGDGLARTIKFSDAPGLTTPPHYIRSAPNSVLNLTGAEIRKLVEIRNGYAIRHVKGLILFRAAVVAFSLDAPCTYVVLGWMDWSLLLDQELTVEFDDTQLGVRLNLGQAGEQGTRHVATRILSRPLEARAAGIETYGPIAIGEGEDDADYSLYRWVG